MRFWKIIVIIALLTLAIPIPIVKAIPDGAAPSAVCTADLTATADLEYGNGESVSTAPARALSSLDGNGNFYFAFGERIKTGTFTNDYRVSIRKVSPTCAILDYSLCDAIECPHDATDSTLSIRDFTVDFGGRVVASYHYSHGATQKAFIESFDSATGVRLKRSFDLASLSPSWDGGNSGIVSVRNGTTDVDYIIADATANRLMKVNSNLTMIKWIQSVGTGDKFLLCCSADESKFYMTRETGASTAVLGARLVSSGAASGSEVTYMTGNFGAGNSRVRPPEVGYVDTTKVFSLNRNQAAIVSNSQTRYSNTVPTLAAQTATALSFSEINDGSYRQTLPVDFAVDGADNILACGRYLVGAPNFGYLAYYGPSEMEWNITYPTLTDSNVYACQVMVTGGIGVALQHDTGAFINNIRYIRYSGGDSVGVTWPRFIVSFPEEESPSVVNPVEDAKEVFREAWNLEEETVNWLFGIAVIGIVTFAFAASRSTMLTAIGAMLGVGLATALGFIPLWFLLLCVFVIVAIASHRLFGKGENQ